MNCPGNTDNRNVCRVWLFETDTGHGSRRRLPREERAALARWCIASHLGIDEAMVTIGRLPSGQPVLRAPELPGPFSFSLSDTDGRLAIATMFSQQLGIDIESIAGRDVPLGALHWLAPAEAAAVVAAPAQLRRLVFLGIWTQKEAYLKALGTGLAAALNSFSVEPQHDLPAGLYEPIPRDAESNLSLRRICHPQIVGAVASQCDGMCIELTCL